MKEEINNLEYKNNGTALGYVGSSAAIITGGAAGNLAIGTNANLSFATGTAYTERMRITSDGNVGIGGSITSLSDSDDLSFFAGTTVVDNRARIELYGPTHATLANQTFIRGNQIIFTSDAAATERMRITSTGQMIIGDTSMTFGNNQGYVAGFKGASSSQTFISLAKVGQSLSSQGFMIGLDNSAAYLYNHDNTAMLFVNNAIERMRITSSGNVLIGTTTDNGLKLQVSGNASISGSGNSFNIFSNNNSLSLALGYQGVAHGYLGGISSRLEAYSSNGGYVFLNSSSVWVAASDAKRKRNFETYSNGLSAILGLQPKLYNMDFQKDGDEKQVGLVAQEVKDFIPKAYEDNNNFIGLNYNTIIITMINAIKEQQTQIESLKVENNTLKETLTSELQSIKDSLKCNTTF
jgi:hypothetical protein